MSKKTIDSGSTPDASAAAGAATVKARVLTSCAYGLANDIAHLEADVAAQAQADGLVDTAPEAVAYAESLAAGQA